MLSEYEFTKQLSEELAKRANASPSKQWTDVQTFITEQVSKRVSIDERLSMEINIASTMLYTETLVNFNPESYASAQDSEGTDDGHVPGTMSVAIIIDATTNTKLTFTSVPYGGNVTLRCSVNDGPCIAVADVLR